MATASVVSVNVTNTGVSVVVPDDDIARLMYYLHCVTMGVGLDILHDDLVDYKNYQKLSPVRKAAVLKSALEFSPDEFINKLIIRDDEGEVITGSSPNKFCNISVACDIISLRRDVLVAGEMRNVTKVMFFKSVWLDTYYTHPIARLILGTRHCVHCKGVDGVCACDDGCPRSSDSKCQPLLTMLIDTLRSTAISPPSPPPNFHQCICDGCSLGNFEGTRYKCAICTDFDLCQKCYRGDSHDLSHAFMQIDRPGSSPVRLAPRAPPPATRAPTSPPATAPPRSSSTAQRYFYHDMTVSELKGYLREHGVVYTDILDKETLCRRVWEAHCDCMSMAELATFLRENNISTSDCRDVASRRQKAKRAFQRVAQRDVPRARRPPILEHDVVTLTGLNRAVMNGKRATVVQPDCGGGRAEVRLEESGDTFRVKHENIVVVSNDNSSEYLD